MSKKGNYYSMQKLLACDAHYNIMIGERSNGKSYAPLLYAWEKYLKTGEKLAIIRRWNTDFQGQLSARTCYNSLMCNGDGENIIKKLSNNAYAGVEYYGGRYFLTVEENGRTVRSDAFIAYGFALNMLEHYKSGSFPDVSTIFYDEFIPKDAYLTDEFIVFQNMISTIVRQRDNVKIFMAGNTINKYGNPYFKEMGLYKVKDMQKDTIDVYTYGETPLRVAVEFTDTPSKTKPSDVYFAFKNPKLQMIKGTGGVWEIGIYPHCPCKIRPKDITFLFFVKYEENTLQCEIIERPDEKMLFMFVHRKTTPVRDEDKALVYTPDYDPHPNVRRSILRRTDDTEEKLNYFIRCDKVFYQDNEVGEIFNSYLDFCQHR